MGHIDSVKVGCEKIGMTLVTEIDRTIKKYFDDLLHAVDGLSARLSQLESKTHQVENAVDDLKDSAEYNHGITDRNLRQLENILVEVEDGILFLKDKQEITETQLRLSKLQGLIHNRQSEERNCVVQTDSVQQMNQPIAFSGAPSLAHPTPSPSAPILTYQNPPPAAAPIAAQVTSQIPQNSIPSTLAESYYQPLRQTLESTYHQFYQPAPQHPQVSQPQQLSQPHPPLAFNPRNHPPLDHHFEETHYMPSQPPGGFPSQQFFVDSTQQMHGQPFRRPGPNLDFPMGYSQTPGPANFGDMHPYVGSSSHYGNSTMEKSKVPPPHCNLTDGSNYARLPKAQILPHALPTASSIGSESGSGESGEKVPSDDIIEKVTAMGFRRDHVKATVKKLMENGNSVDLNVVLDKMMSNGNVHHQDGRFGR
ncbi:uncharacterized protein LOC132304330 isoform X2 [Cornus florida]|nr:uncharacterized protein LOC132304330 isoform X2 [Cornus florida]